MYLSVVSRVETSKILKNCISNIVSDLFVIPFGILDLVLDSVSAEVFEYELFTELLGLAVAVLGFLVQTLGLLQRVRPLQGPSIQSGLQGGVVENAAGQEDG